MENELIKSNIMESEVKRETVNKMINYKKQEIADYLVKVDFYMWLSTQVTDEKESATWRVQADKTKEEIKVFKDVLEKLQKFAQSF